MKTLFSIHGALAGMLSASALFAQAPGNYTQQSAYRPGATYFAQPNEPARLWNGSTSQVSYRSNPQEQLPVEGNNDYLNALEGQPGASCLQQPAAPGAGYVEGGMPAAGYGSGAAYGAGEGAAYGEGVVYGSSEYGVYGGGLINPCARWFVYGGGLIMDRNDENELWLSYDTGDYAARVLGSRDAEMDWTGGYEIEFGRYFANSNTAVGVTFWMLQADSETSRSNTDLVGNLNTVLEDPFQGLTYNNGTAANIEDYFNNANTHRLRRDYDFYNVEVNLFQDPTMYAYDCGCGSFSIGGLAGIRYFQFSEGLAFSADTHDYVYDGNVNELHYVIDVENHLVGPQIGFTGAYNHGRWSLNAGTKFGIFGNNISHSSSIFGANGFAYIDNGLSPNNGENFDIDANKTDVSFLGEIDLGATYRVGCHFSLTAGYRAVAVTGVALSTTQVPQNFEDLEIVRQTQNNGDIVLHGAYAGGEFTW